MVTVFVYICTMTTSTNDVSIRANSSSTVNKDMFIDLVREHIEAINDKTVNLSIYCSDDININIKLYIPLRHPPFHSLRQGIAKHVTSPYLRNDLLGSV